MYFEEFKSCMFLKDDYFMILILYISEYNVNIIPVSRCVLSCWRYNRRRTLSVPHTTWAAVAKSG